MVESQSRKEPTMVESQSRKEPTMVEQWGFLKKKSYNGKERKNKMKNTNKTMGFLERTYNGRTKQRNGMALAVFIISLVSFSLTGLVSAEGAVLYNDNGEYSGSHGYDIPDSFVYTAKVNTRGTTGGECVYATFSYSSGTTYTSACQSVAYLSWTPATFTNAYPNLQVSSITLTGGRHSYMKEFFAYGESEYTGTNPETLNGGTNPDCGNNIKEGEEECDNGQGNGVLCSAGYNSFCNYCSNYCEIEKVQGGFCGDGVLQGTERCDDGNLMNGDGCSAECKKPFQVTVEDFPPIVWQCDHRIVYDDGTEPGRISENGEELVERRNDYAFEGEQIQWRVLVMDKNGIEKVKEVYATVDNEIEANCDRLDGYSNNNINTAAAVTGKIDPSCNARILEEKITTFNPETMAYYLCTLTVETTDSMYGEYDVTVEAEDLDGIIGQMDETERWFLNPEISLLVYGELLFDEVRPGTSTYSERVLVGNNADDGSGVILDMFISGTDFYDSASSGAKCPTSNQLELENLRYYASNGGYSTNRDLRADDEGYVPIQYGLGFNSPYNFYNRNEIIQTQKLNNYYTSNILSPGAEMSLVFRLNLPEPCNGDFDTGQIYFWGEAI